MTIIHKVLPFSMVLGLIGLLGACSPDDGGGEPEPEAEAALDSREEGLSCAARTDTGYSAGKAFTISVIEVDGYPVERETANHYVAMQRDAQVAGVRLRITSGFRTMAEQEYLYGCYINKNCNGGNEAARPGYSNHQSGKALDIDRNGGALGWLNANAARFGFKRTVASEDWHWEWLGGGASVDVCGGSVGSDGCTDTERSNAAAYGCACVDHLPSGGYCPGSGCTAKETNDCGAYGTVCVDHKCSGGFTDGSGCTAKETNDCAAYGTACVDHKCSGGYTDGSGCTAKETNDCASFGAGCVDHKCAGGFAPGTGCTAKETDNCASVGCECREHKCAGGFCPAG